MGKSGKNLKVALQSQQQRLKAKQKASQAVQTAEQKSRRKGPQPKADRTDTIKNANKTNLKGKGKAIPRSQRPTIPFLPTDRILLIGEGNFSFARSLVCDPPLELRHLPPKNIVATAYDSEEGCYEKYSDAEEIVSELKEIGVNVLFGVDGTRLERHASLKGQKFDRIVWNFPHVGKGITDQDRNILSNQALILDFLRSAAKLLLGGPAPVAFTPRKKIKSEDDDDDDDEDLVEVAPIVIVNDDDNFSIHQQKGIIKTRGTVLITLRNVAPYTLWDIPRLAKNPPPPPGSTPLNPRFTLLRSFAFHRDMWKRYEHRMTKGERAHGTGKTGEGGEDRTWEFYLRDD